MLLSCHLVGDAARLYYAFPPNYKDGLKLLYHKTCYHEDLTNDNTAEAASSC